MRIAIITENFLSKLDGVTRTLAKLLEHLQLSGHKVILLGPESGMEEYAGALIHYALVPDTPISDAPIPVATKSNVVAVVTGTGASGTRA